MQTCLALVRRHLYGSLEDAAQITGVPRSTQQRAEAGVTVSDRTRALIEGAYGDSLDVLQRPFLEELG